MKQLETVGEIAKNAYPSEPLIEREIVSKNFESDAIYDESEGERPRKMVRIEDCAPSLIFVRSHSEDHKIVINNGIYSVARVD